MNRSVASLRSPSRSARPPDESSRDGIAPDTPRWRIFTPDPPRWRIFTLTVSGETVLAFCLIA
jgi:hypothetical protein